MEGLSVDRAGSACRGRQPVRAASGSPCGDGGGGARRLSTRRPRSKKTNANVRPALLETLRVGEEHGCLAESLSSFARRTRGFTAGRFLKAIGRSPHATEFAATLARLLRDQRLSVEAVLAAGQSAADGSGRFARAIGAAAERIADGESLSEALGRYPAHFDALYLEFLDASRSRRAEGMSGTARGTPLIIVRRQALDIGDGSHGGREARRRRVQRGREFGLLAM